MIQVEHDEQADHFTVDTRGGEAELAYLEEPDRQVLDLLHTFVPPEARGQGIGKALVEYAVDYARQKGYRVRPSCPFVRAWFEKHPEQGELVAPRS